MITCPWCGTSYTTFLPNCKNCGGPLPPQTVSQPETGELPLYPPPPAPRSISNSYIWKLLMADGWAIASFVFLLLGVIFGLVGLGLTAGIVTAIVGIPFVLLGMAFLAAGGGVIYWRYREMQKIVNVLRWGESMLGQVTDVRENIAVMINDRHPWVIEYEFTLNGQEYRGSVSSLNRPSRQFQPGKPTYILYMQDNPNYHTIYPHP